MRGLFEKLTVILLVLFLLQFPLAKAGDVTFQDYVDAILKPLPKFSGDYSKIYRTPMPNVQGDYGKVLTMPKPALDKSVVDAILRPRNEMQEEDEYSIAKKFSVMMSLGFHDPKNKFDFEKGIFQNNVAEVDASGCEDFWDIAMNLGFKYSLCDYFSVGVTIDYRMVRIDSLEMVLDNGNFLKSRDVGNFNITAAMFMVEGRSPAIFGPSTLLGPAYPYLQMGFGINLNMISDDTILRVDQDISFAFMIGGGLEVFMPKSNTFSMFFEAKWYYNSADVTFNPANGTKFSADLDLSSVGFFSGMNIYFGGK